MLVSLVFMIVSFFTLDLGVPQILMMPSVTCALIQSPNSDDHPGNRIWIPMLAFAVSIFAFWTHVFVFKATVVSRIEDGAALILGIVILVASVKLANYEASAEGKAAEIAKTEGSR